MFQKFINFERGGEKIQLKTTVFDIPIMEQANMPLRILKFLIIRPKIKTEMITISINRNVHSKMEISTTHHGQIMVAVFIKMLEYFHSKTTDQI